MSNILYINQSGGRKISKLRILRLGFTAMILTVLSACGGGGGGNGSPGSGNTQQFNGLLQLVNDSSETDEDVSLEIPASDLLSNDTYSGASTGPLSVVDVTTLSTTNGTISLDAGVISYTPTADFYGTASFEYVVEGPLGERGSAIVSVTVNSINDVPVAVEDLVSTDANTALTISTTDLLSNDSDADGDNLTVISVQAQASTNGTVSLNGGDVNYQPSQGFVGLAEFTYRISDGAGGEVDALVKVTVSNPSLPPVATLPSFSPAAGTYTGSVTVVLTSATPGATIYYTTDGTDPQPSVSASVPSGGSVLVDVSLTLKALATANGFTDSFINSNAYTIVLPPATLPSFSPVAGTYVGPLTVVLASATSGATIYYTTNGSNPQPGVSPSVPSGGSVVLAAGRTLKALATANGFADSVISSSVYIVGNGFNEALYAMPQASNGGATAEEAIDSVSGVANNAWIASAAGGDSLTLNFDTTKAITKVVLMDRVSATDNVLQAKVTFSNGDSFSTGALLAAGGPVNFDFLPKNVDWVRVTLNNVEGASPGLDEFEAYSLLDQQSIQNQEHFSDGNANGWLVTDNGTINGPSNWSVLNGEYVQNSGTLGQTADGFEIGTYAAWNTVTHNAMDLHVRLRSDGIGVVGVMFGYQDDNNYYRFSLSQREGYQKLEMKKAGIFTELATSPQSYTVGAWTNIRIVLQNGVIVAFVDGEQVMATADASFASGKLGLWASRNISASSSYDKVILLSASSKPVIGLELPGEFFVETGTVLDVSALTTQSVGGVEFVVDAGMAGSQTDTVLGAPYTTQFSLGAGEHTVNAYALDNTATRLSHADAQDTLIQVGIGGIHLVGFGDSITDGVGDDISSDDVSSDGRNTSGGYEPILNNTLTAAASKPVTVIDEGNPSDRATDGEGKIVAVLARTPEAQAYLIMFGTNDAGGSLPALDTDFKASLKTIVDAILAVGKTAFIAKPPLRVGQTTRNTTIEGYNLQIDALISDYALSNPGVVFAGPDFYTYFTANQGEIGADALHPTGVGYQSMGQQWSNIVEGKF